MANKPHDIFKEITQIFQNTDDPKEGDEWVMSDETRKELKDKLFSLATKADFVYLYFNVEDRADMTPITIIETLQNITSLSEEIITFVKEKT